MHNYIMIQKLPKIYIILSVQHTPFIILVLGVKIEKILKFW